MTENRPTLQRKVTPKTEASRKSQLDVGVQITYEGTEYTVRAGDLTALDAQALRKELGLSFMGMLDALGKDPDIDLIAGVVWLSRRAKGDPVPYAVVAEEMGYDAFDSLLVEPVNGAEETDPEA